MVYRRLGNGSRLVPNLSGGRRSDPSYLDVQDLWGVEMGREAPITASEVLAGQKAVRARLMASENALLERVCKVMGGPLSEKDRPEWEDAMFEAKAKFFGQTKDFGDIRPDIDKLLETEAVQLT